MEFGQVMSNENQQAKLKTFSTLEMVLHERSNIAAFSVEHQKFPERKKRFIWNVSSWQIKVSD